MEESGRDSREDEGIKERKKRGGERREGEIDERGRESKTRTDFWHENLKISWSPAVPSQNLKRRFTARLWFQTKPPRLAAGARTSSAFRTWSFCLTGLIHTV